MVFRQRIREIMQGFLQPVSSEAKFVPRSIKNIVTNKRQQVPLDSAVLFTLTSDLLESVRH